MGKTKSKIAFFTLLDYKKEEKWLQKQHKVGLRLVKATVPCFYKFEECEPEDVVYQLDYNEEAMKNKDEYVQMFNDCGWEYITDINGYCYFRKPALQMVENEEIFSDDESKMDMIDRIFKGRMIPLLTIFFAIIIPQIFMQRSIDEPIAWGLFWVYIGLFVLYLLIFIDFAVKYAKLKKQINK